MLMGLDYLSAEERAARKARMSAFAALGVEHDLSHQGGACGEDGICVGFTVGRARKAHGDEAVRLWCAILLATEDWAERIALMDAHACVAWSFGEMMLSKAVFGQRDLETAASLLSEFLAYDQTAGREERLVRADLLARRLSDISLGLGEDRALRTLSKRLSIERAVLTGEVSTWK